MQKIIKETVNTLKNGGIILYPTDTIWGIGCDATNEKAVKKIYYLKKRIYSKALISLVANKKQLSTHTDYIPIEAFNAEPTTIIYSSPKGLAKNLMADDNSAAIRITKDQFCKKIILKLGKAIVSTSANISGQNNASCFNEISNDIIKGVDYVVNLRKNDKMTTASSILKIKNNREIIKIR